MHHSIHNSIYDCTDCTYRIHKSIYHIYSMQQICSMHAAAAAAKSLQSCPTVWPHRRQPTRLPRPWDSPGNNTGVGCHFLLQCMKVESENWKWSRSVVSDPMDCSLPGSSIHRIFQARVLEWGTIAFSEGFFWGWVQMFGQTRVVNVFSQSVVYLFILLTLSLES